MQLELSDNARVLTSFGTEQLRCSSHTVTMQAIHSRELLCRLWFGGICPFGAGDMFVDDGNTVAVEIGNNVMPTQVTVFTSVDTLARANFLEEYNCT
jgi:hypothetical protein